MFDLMLKQAREDFETVEYSTLSLFFTITENDTRKLEKWIFRHLEPKGLNFGYQPGTNKCTVYLSFRNDEKKYDELNIHQKINLKSNLSERLRIIARKSKLIERYFYSSPNSLNR